MNQYIIVVQYVKIKGKKESDRSKKEGVFILRDLKGSARI